MTRDVLLPKCNAAKHRPIHLEKINRDSVSSDSGARLTTRFVLACEPIGPSFGSFFVAALLIIGLRNQWREHNAISGRI